MKKTLIYSGLIILFTLSSCISTKGVPYKKNSDQAYSDTIKNSLDHSIWDKLLKQNVREDGLVAYEGFKADQKILNDYVQYLSEQVPDKSWSYEEQLAYFINVYNANTIKLIVDHYPVESIKKVDATISPFLKNFIFIGEKEFSLADIEKGFLQKMNEPRIHFAINCASISCPKLLREAYTAKNVNELMDRAAKEFINSDKNEISENSAKVSEIFKWYKKDFLLQSESIIDYINQYADTKINPNVELSYIEYNWDLNDVE
ncbi:DUF547 domain-containing protein [Winogradskyella ouciana]|uniref:DUF547 domain-containing protein n=1 Tax=Winogradskyella ouciana TaxID=2608631 RepID=A0A7K1GC28_9FLAO|nr:DUF547 domain-containing protein [Winogradskyella ouciana]MTE25938.1 DUF547 domain-containing protein [Winogradskyella ouciana]